MKINRGHHPYIQRILSLLLVFSLVFGMITPAFAQEAANQGSSVPATGAQADQNVQTQADQSVQTQAAAANPADVAPRSVTQENGMEVVRFDYKSSEVNVLVTLKNPEDLPADAVLSVTPVALDNTAQAKVDSEVKKDNRSIQSQKTFDIKFLQNGKEVEPGSTVKVTITLPDMPANTKAEVLHVSDDSQSVENTNAQTAADGKLQLETNSFSRYVIVNYSYSAVTINIERYVLDKSNLEDLSKAKLTYRSDKKIEGINEEGQMEQVVTYDLSNYDCQKIVKVEDGKEENIALSGNGKVNIRAEKDMTLKLYYKAKEGQTEDPVTLFDYDVNNNGNNKETRNTYINTNTNYLNYNAEKDPTDGRVGVGDGKSNYRMGLSGNGRDGNNWTQNADGLANDVVAQREKFRVAGIVTGLNGFSQDQQTGEITSLGTPVFGSGKYGQIYDPGLFTTEQDDAALLASGALTTARTGKHVLTDYKLQFDQDGDHFHLADALNPDGTTASKYKTFQKNTGYNFFPLDEVQNYHNYEPVGIGKSATDGKQHNHYFGMRYDIKFKLGDYVGDLNYKFKGDDDMWVILDGEKVVIDLGGIHSALTQDLDLWEVLYAKQNGVDVSDEQAVKAFINGNGEGLKEFKNNKTRSDAINGEWHTLTILYMERGANRSNCYMDFTIPNVEIAEVTKTPKGSLSFNKVSVAIDETTGQIANTPLKGANFSIKKVGEKDAANFAESDENGNVTFGNIAASDQIYEIKEEEAPTGYVTTQDTYYAKATLNEDATVVTVEGLFTDKECTQKLESNTVVNYPVKAYLDQKKTAKLYDWNERTYMINLKVGQHIPRLEKMDDAVITDVIDPRFELIDKNGTLLKAGDHINADGVKDSGGDGVVSVGEYSGNQCYRVIWSNQSIPGLNTGEEINNIDLSSWSKNIFIRAKNEYVGGNNVPTNVYPDSNVVVNLVTSPFKQPKVNVKPRLFINDLTKTVFAGDTIYHNDSVSKMFNVSTDGSQNGVAQCDMIGTEYKSIATPTNGHLKTAWYSDAEGTTATTLPDNTPTTVKSPSEKKYYLRAAYTFDTPEDASLLNSKEIKEGGDGKNHYAGEDENEAVSTATDGTTGSGNNGATPTPTASGSNSGSTGNTNGQTTSQSGSGEAFNAQSITVPDDYYIYVNGQFSYNGQTKGWGYVKVNDFNKITLTDSTKNNLYTYSVAQIESDETVINDWNNTALQSKKDLDDSVKAKVIDHIIVDVLKDTSDYYVQFNASGDDNYQGSYSGFFNINKLNSLNLTDAQKNIIKNSQSFVKLVGKTEAFTTDSGNGVWYAPQQIKDYVHGGDWSKPFATGTSTNSSNNNGGNNNNNNNNNNDQTPGSDAVSTQGLNIGNNLYILAKNAGHLTRNDVFLKDGAQAHKDQLYGVYTVHVVKGQIQITKKIDSQYSGTQAIKANQSFVFRIDVYNANDQGLPAGDIQKTFYETIAFSANEGKTSKTKLISNLPKGVYVVTEETDWSPKYTLQSASGGMQNGNGIYLNVGTLVGTDDKGVRTFTGVECFKYGQDKASITPYTESDAKYIYLSGNDHYANNQPAESSFINNLNGNWKWLSDTAAAINQFTN
ncbi:MAG: hypothetical protein IJG85_00210 [Eubacteriaceae bacterium]|nr:hypothetical protein [Eubacteriaceae bacterium]